MTKIRFQGPGVGVLDTRYVNVVGDNLEGNLNMGTNILIGGTAVTDILKLQGTSGNGTLTSPAIQLLTGNNGTTTALTVLNNGNVGIGTTVPTRKLHLYKTTGSITTKIETGSADYVASEFFNSVNQVSLYLGADGKFHYYDGGDLFTIDTNGNVGIGVTDPDVKLEVFGSAGLKISFDATDNTTLVTDTNGDLTVTPSGDEVILADAKNLTVGTTTGTQLATNTAQKMSFWGVTPVVQQVFATGASHTVDELITVLQTLGLVKQS